jgi:L-threonylcarbamoyladenylate synthase
VKLIDPSRLAQAVGAINDGDLVVVPTQRWYMVCADASNAKACERIFTAKQRPASKSLALVVRSVDHARDLFVMSPAAELLCRSFWPGNLAMLLHWRRPSDGDTCAAVGARQALVTCSSGVLGELAAAASVPVAATTVNVSGEASGGRSSPAITTFEVGAFVAESGLDVALCIDGGICPAVSHLTIVDCTDLDLPIIRPGLVHERAIAAALSQS